MANDSMRAQHHLLLYGKDFENWAMDRKTHYPYNFDKTLYGYLSLFTQAIWTAWLAGKTGQAEWQEERQRRGRLPKEYR